MSATISMELSSEFRLPSLDISDMPCAFTLVISSQLIYAVRIDCSKAATLVVYNKSGSSSFILQVRLEIKVRNHQVEFVVYHQDQSTIQKYTSRSAITMCP